jgi:hypothetical protein
MVYPVDSEGLYAIRCKTCYSIVGDIPVSHMGVTPFLKKKDMLAIPTCGTVKYTYRHVGFLAVT